MPQRKADGPQEKVGESLYNDSRKARNPDSRKMHTFKQSEEFRLWMHKLDNSVQGIIAARVNRARRGQLGKALGGTGGISELIVDTGPGYRLYYCQAAEAIY